MVHHNAPLTGDRPPESGPVCGRRRMAAPPRRGTLPRLTRHSETVGGPIPGEWPRGDGGPLQPPSLRHAPHTDPGGAAHHHGSRSPPLGPSSDCLPARSQSVHRAPRTQPVRHRPSVVPGPRHRTRRPTVRARRTGRPDPCRHREARQHPRLRWPPGAWASGRPKEPHRPGLQLPPQRRRRSLPLGPRRNPRRSEEGDRIRIPDPGTGLLQPDRHHRPSGS